MKDRIYIKDLKDHIGKDIDVNGFVQTIRDQNKIIFLIVRDISGIIQAVAFQDLNNFMELRELSVESVVRIHGLVKEEKQAPDGYELQIKSITILSRAEPELPIPVVTEKGGEETNLHTRLDYRWIDLRKPEKSLAIKTWTALERGVREFFYQNGWLQIYTPSFMETSSETGAEMFSVNYFDRKVYLAQSPQFYKQMAIAAGLEKVFMAGPVFRAEESFTTRHVTEFTGWDIEMAYVESIKDIIDAEENLLISGFKEVGTQLPEINLVIPTKPFPQITLAEAKTKLKEAGVHSEEDYDLSPEEERSISEIIKKETNHDFVFITDWHISKRPFYHMRREDNPEITRSADLIYKGIEITTLAQREHRVDILERQAKEKKMNLKELKHYFDFFRYGCPPHGGAGIGPGRLIMKMLDLPNIREATFLPRDVKRLNP